MHMTAMRRLTAMTYWGTIPATALRDIQEMEEFAKVYKKWAINTCINLALGN